MIHFAPLLGFFACIEQSDEATTETAPEETTEENPSVPVDLEDPDQNLEAFVKTRGSLNPEDEIVFYWKGAIYNHNEADPYATALTSYYSAPIMYFEGFNIARFEQLSDTEYQFYSREINVYKNSYNKIIDCWSNRDIGGTESVRVIHVQNDPVNFAFSGSDYRELDGMIAWNMEVLLSYPSALPVEDYPELSAGNTYQSTELFNFYSDRADLENPELDTVPVHLSWTRIGQYLPWMRMGTTEGKLIYHAQGYKVSNGWDGLPEDLKEWTLQNAPAYQHPPERDEYPNMTSWRYMRKLLNEGRYEPECP